MRSVMSPQQRVIMFQAIRNNRYVDVKINLFPGELKTESRSLQIKDSKTTMLERHQSHTVIFDHIYLCLFLTTNFLQHLGKTHECCVVCFSQICCRNDKHAHHDNPRKNTCGETASGTVPQTDTQQGFKWGDSAPRSEPLPFYIPFLSEKAPLS